MALVPGLEKMFEHVVTEKDTAISVRSGDVNVLSTPVLVAFCENAAVRAVKNELPENETTVGVRIDIQHLAPSAVGARVMFHARLESVEGRKLTFRVWARDGNGDIAHGTHVRMRVDRERFMKQATERS
ncbi:MAG: thioesterase family protein [Actinomycetota bacterium]